MPTGNRPLKADKWWNYKVPPLLAVAYYVLSQAEPAVPTLTVLLHLGLFLVATIGIAGFGHLLNDLADIEDDAKSNSRNMAARLSRPRLLLLFLLLLAMGLLPWFYLPLGWPGLGLIAFELLLFIIYSLPPVRLKERGFAGVFADALYAHVVPILVAWLTFAHLGGVAPPGWFGGLLAVWALAAGLRNILHHQIVDLERERLSGATTFVVGFGPEKTMRLGAWILAVELLSFVLLLAVLGRQAPAAAVGFAAYFSCQLFIIRYVWLGGGSDLGQHTLTLGYQLLSRFYESWWGVLILLGLVIDQLHYLGLAGLHLALFGQMLATLIWQDLQNLKNGLGGLRQKA